MKIKKRYWTILFFITLGSVSIHISGHITKKVIQSNVRNITQMEIENIDKFIELQEYFTKRNIADGSTTYILQPKDYIKLYKESVNTYTIDTTSLNLPNKIKLDDEILLQRSLAKKDFAKIYPKTDSIYHSKSYEVAYILPIYHYRTHVGEFFLFFKKDPNYSNNKIKEITTELQAFSSIIK